MSLYDLGKHFGASMSGLRADLTEGINAEPETPSPGRLTSKANLLYDTARLKQAVGDDRANNLLRAIETTKQRVKDATEDALRQEEAAHRLPSNGQRQ